MLGWEESRLRGCDGAAPQTSSVTVTRSAPPWNSATEVCDGGRNRRRSSRDEQACCQKPWPKAKSSGRRPSGIRRSAVASSRLRRHLVQPRRAAMRERRARASRRRVSSSETPAGPTAESDGDYASAAGETLTGRKERPPLSQAGSRRPRRAQPVPARWRCLNRTSGQAEQHWAPRQQRGNPGCPRM